MSGELLVRHVSCLMGVVRGDLLELGGILSGKASFFSGIFLVLCG